MLTANLVGNVGGDPELRYAPSGTAVMRFNVASNYGKKNNEGEWENRVEWVRVIIFGDRAEKLAEIVKKGQKVYVGGNLEADPWTPQDGAVRAGLQIIARDVEVLTPRDQNGTGGSNRGWGNDMTGSPSRPRSTVAAGADDPDDLEDLPF